MINKKNLSTYVLTHIQNNNLKHLLNEKGITLLKPTEADFLLMKPYLHPHDLQYFFLEAGVEHYRLLNYISFLSGQWLAQEKPSNLRINILDLGTQFGGSSIALSNDLNVDVTTYDLEDKRDGKKWPSNITFKLGDCIDLQEDFHQYQIIMMDVNHDGQFEHKLFQFLNEIKWEGLMILDDIHLNNEMKEFWNNITQEKYDLTSIGHWSGTGLVIF